MNTLEYSDALSSTSFPRTKQCWVWT